MLRQQHMTCTSYLTTLVSNIHCIYIIYIYICIYIYYVYMNAGIGEHLLCVMVDF